MLQCSYDIHENIVNCLGCISKRDSNTPMGVFCKERI